MLSNLIISAFVLFKLEPTIRVLKECMSDSVTNYNYVGDTKIRVYIKNKLMPTNAH